MQQRQLSFKNGAPTPALTPHGECSSGFPCVFLWYGGCWRCDEHTERVAICRLHQRASHRTQSRQTDRASGREVPKWTEQQFHKLSRTQRVEGDGVRHGQYPFAPAPGGLGASSVGSSCTHRVQWDWLQEVERMVQMHQRGVQPTACPVWPGWGQDVAQ